MDWIDIYGNAGLGFFSIDETNISANLGGGLLFWINGDKTFGIRAQVIGKFAFNHSDSGLDNNHYQYHLQAVFKLSFIIELILFGSYRCFTAILRLIDNLL